MTKRSLLSELELVDAAVSRDATFAEAARALAASEVAAIAVVDERRRVVGLFTEDDLLGGVFAEYLEELQHTAFLEPNLDTLLQRAREVADEPLDRHMTNATMVDVGASSAHLAERFLHAESGAVAVTEAGAFVGMVSETDFCRSLVRRLGDPG